MDWRRFLGELQRRNVYRVAITYTVVSWVLIQIATQVFPFFEIPIWAVRLVVLLLVLGFPVALIFAWAFELTPEGIKRTEEVPPHESIAPQTGRKLTGLIVALGLVAAGLFALSCLRRNPGGTAPAVLDAPLKSNAVITFDN